ncbi:hypothetical protein SDC9_174004 [bioreactor metagenome]|uniref:Uncharacterized protein n=1 Tax=bioreactor metagenome TaxID=1076179 RepID=A0A645GL48_9ZZZZ
MWNGSVAAAVVTAQAPVCQMHHQVGRTVRAAADPATGRAGQHGCIAAPVEKHQALLPPLQTFANRGLQCGAEALVQLQPSGIDTAHLGQ